MKMGAEPAPLDICTLAPNYCQFFVCLLAYFLPQFHIKHYLNYHIKFWMKYLSKLFQIILQLLYTSSKDLQISCMSVSLYVS